MLLYKFLAQSFAGWVDLGLQCHFRAVLMTVALERVKSEVPYRTCPASSHQQSQKSSYILTCGLGLHLFYLLRG